MLLQGITALTGILVIRNLNKSEYALYTISYSMQSSIATLSEIGIASVVISLAGKVWNDAYRFGSLMNTAQYVRKYLIFFASLLIIPILLYLLTNQGATVKYAVAISSIIMIELLFKISTSYKILVPRFHSQIRPILQAESKAQILRLALVIISFFTFCNTLLLALTSCVCAFVNNHLIRPHSDSKIDLTAPIEKKYKEEMVSIIKSQIFYNLFFVMQGQVTIFIISYFGQTENISEIGALSRLAVIFNIFMAAIVNFLVPKFSKEDSVIRLRRLFFFAVTVFILPATFLVLGSFFFSDLFLWILGSKYQNLSNELPFMVILSIMNTFIGLLYSLNYAKAWIKWNWIVIPFTVLTQVVVVMHFNLSTVFNVIVFGIVSLVPSLIVNSYMVFRGLKYV